MWLTTNQCGRKYDVYFAKSYSNTRENLVRLKQLWNSFSQWKQTSTPLVLT